MKMNKKSIKLVVTMIIVGFFLWFLVIYPMIVFHSNEKEFLNAAKDYFDMNQGELPKGKRVKTLSLKTLYYKSFLKKSLYSPYTKKTCSISKSWVKVRYEDGDYKYYVYLDCGGALHSLVDYKGPEIRLNGDSIMTLGIGEEFNDPGVKNVIDGNDGVIKNSEVSVKGKVNTSSVGQYEITYTAFDSLSNKTTVTRTVQVVQKLYQTVRSKLNGTRNYVGNPENNYLRISNQLFRIYGVDDNNVIIVANEDVANVNYSKLDKWLDYYYEHLDETAKKLIVSSQFCNMNVADTSLDTTQCNSYTSKKKIYVPSVVEVNLAAAGNDNFMKTKTMSWVANKKSETEAYVTRDIFFDDAYGKSFLPYSITDNYGVRPMMVIKGDALITGGDGSYSNPYVFDGKKKGAVGKSVHNRFTGEYILEGSVLWRIIDTLDDGTTKIISVSNISSPTTEVECYPDPEINKIIYNPKDKKSIGYYYNNDVSEFIDTSKFAEHSVDVPIYKNKIIYGEEIQTKKYNVVLSAPNMYDLFSAQSRNLFGYSYGSYWLINSSNAKRTAGVITDIGVPLNEEVPDYFKAGVKVVGYLKKDVIVSSGRGTIDSPYLIK